MAINHKALEARIKKAAADKRKSSIGCGNGLTVIVSTGGTASFYASLKAADGKPKKCRLGKFPEMSLSAARKKTEELRKQLEEEKLNLELLSPLFKDVAAEWYNFKAKNVGKLRLNTLRSLLNHLEVFNGWRVKKLTPREVVPVIEKSDMSGGQQHRAVRVLIDILNYSVNRGYIEINPCSLLTASGSGFFPNVKGQGFASVPPEELKSKFFDRLINATEQAKLILLYIALSCARMSEALNLRWSWIDFKENIITVPAEHMKMRREFRYPLTPQLKQVIEAYTAIFPRHGDQVFYKPNDTDQALPARYIQEPVRAACKDIATIHGLRKTARTWFASKHMPFEAAEMCLAHADNSKIVRTYQKYDFLEERRDMLQQWNEFVISQLPPEFANLLKPE